jgi:hypothetical protein
MNPTDTYRQHNSLFKSLAPILCAVLLFGMLFSSFFISTEFHHDCTGEDCPICQMIALCENFVDQLGAGLIILIAAFFSILIKSDLSLNMAYAPVFATLVRQKVRLNN